MSFKDCLDIAQAGGEISAEQVARLKGDFNRFRQFHLAGGPSMADALAKRDLLALLEKEAMHKRRLAKLAIAAQSRMKADLKSFRNAAGEPDIAAAAIYKLENYDEAPFMSVASTSRHIIGRAQTMMQRNMQHFRRGAFGGDKTRWNLADLKKVVREAFGEDTGDQAAKGLAKEWMNTADWLRRRFNAAGGAIGKLENWGLPQHHSARALRKVGVARWKEDILPRLDLARMTHPLTGRAVDGREIDGVLDEVFAAITTGGWSKRDPSAIPGGRALANQRAEHRFLVFRDATSWLEYQDMYGSGDPFVTMMSHINMMAKDIAAMEVLGPNPSGMLELMKQMVTKETENGAAGAKALVPTEGALGKVLSTDPVYRLDTLWKSIRGELQHPANEFWADTFSVGRSLITASVMGSAAITSLTDIGTGIIARKFAGLPASNAITQVVKAFSGLERNEAVAAGLILDSAMSTFHAEARFAGAMGGPEWANYLVDRVLTYSGLLPFTQAGKHAFGLAFMSEAAKRIELSYDELPAAFRNTFARHGIRPHDWDLIRKTQLHTKYDGTQLLRPSEIAERIDEKLADRWLDMIQSETEFAVPTGGHRARTLLTGNTKAGTLAGEILRSFAQFKSFSVAFMFLHGARMMRMIAADQRRGGLSTATAAYGGGLLFTTWMFGAAVVQINQPLAGRDPRDMTDSGFWLEALAKGGALGLYGDFLFASLSRYDNGLATSIAGPVADRVNETLNLGASLGAVLLSGEKGDFGKELVSFARRNIPGSNIWYLKLGWERVVMDQLQHLADPEANKAFKRRQQHFLRENGQYFFWAQGDRAPSRAPDASAIFGDR